MRLTFPCLVTEGRALRRDSDALPPETEPGGGGAGEAASADIWALAKRVPALGSSYLHDSETGCRLERFVFRGPKGGGETVRIAVFAGIHGDEPAGVAACWRLLLDLATRPEMAGGYELYVYPICNPTGVEARSRVSKSGKDLNREFWKNSSEPEVRLLEREIRTHNFHGLISLHSDDTSPGVYAFVRGAVLGKGLLEPALRAAEKFLPRNTSAVIDGFNARNGIITDCYEGILAAPPSVQLDRAPFEIILETPHEALEQLQVQAFIAAIEAILSEYQTLLSFAADL